ncbi:MAG: DUF2242 domain-containing protein [Gammaproteobacteria bacterium]|nr:DUF2242 domain-containing protein [Gammaproteobacteria bacterium]
MNYRSKIVFLFGCILSATACSNRAVYTEESFADDSPFKMRMDSGVYPVCESARRSLLGQGYLIESTGSDQIKARKAAKRQDNPNTFIEMNIVCLPETTGSTLFATGVLSTYALKKSSSAASVGLSALGSISLPIGQSADSLVKISEETIDDKDFYRRFFAAVNNILSEMQTDRAQPEAVVKPAASAPTPANATSAPVLQPDHPSQAAPQAMPESDSAEPEPADTAEHPAERGAVVELAPGPVLDQDASTIITEPEPSPMHEAPTITPEEMSNRSSDPF